MRNKILLIFVLFFSILITTPFAEDITITTYYPAPYGVYKALRIYPNNAPPNCNAATADDQGVLHYDNGLAGGTSVGPAGFYYCDGTKWQSVGAGYWQLTVNADPAADYLFLNPSTVPDANTRVGIGTATPSYKLDVQNGLINAGGGLIIETRNADPGAGELYNGRIWLIVP